MSMKIVLAVTLALAVLARCHPAARQGSNSSALENAFSHRPTIESIISCFVGRTPCTPLQDGVKFRAMATMRNRGVCPDNICSPQERVEMERAMDLLQRQHPDLWARLIASMFGIDIGRR